LRASSFHSRAEGRVVRRHLAGKEAVSALARADTAIESWNGDSGVVLVQVRSTVTNRVDPQEKSRVWRLRLTMDEVDGVYRTAALEYVA